MVERYGLSGCDLVTRLSGLRCEEVALVVSFALVVVDNGLGEPLASFLFLDC